SRSLLTTVTRRWTRLRLSFDPYPNTKRRSSPHPYNLPALRKSRTPPKRATGITPLLRRPKHNRTLARRAHLHLRRRLATDFGKLERAIDRLAIFQQRIEPLTIDQLDIPSRSKFLRILRERSRRHHITTGDPLRRHAPIQLPHHRHTRKGK